MAQSQATASTRIVELSQRIATNTTKLNDFLEANGLPTPTFDVNGPPGHSIPDDAAGIHAARAAIIDDTQELRRLVLGPKEYLMSYCHDELVAQQGITRFRLAHSFPIGSEATFADIAKSSGLSESHAKQFLRFATMQDIFVESRPGVIAHNAVSRLLAEDDVMHDWADINSDDMWKSAARTCDALEKWRGSQEPHESAFSLSYNSNKPVYEIFGEHPDRGRCFANAMRCFTEGTGFELHHVTDNYSWGDIPDGGTVVDVGGSEGFVCHALAKKYPNIKSFVVQDLPNVIAQAQSQSSSNADSRVSYMAHDFFTEQPVKNADVYILRWILHNWSDARSVRILRNLIPALKQGSKIIINDNILPQPGVLPRWVENRLRSMDLTMLELQNARERELQDWKDLFALADERFKFVGVVMPPGSNLAIIIVEWQG